MMIYQEDLMRAISSQKSIRSFFKQLKRQKNTGLDDRFRTAHEEVFDEIDCLKWANCCKTTSHIFVPSDIDRLAARFKIKLGDFINKYLRLDEEGDYVLKSSPCPFLLKDNT